MFNPEKETVINLSQEDSLKVCHNAILNNGWQISTENSLIILCSKKVKILLLHTISVEVELRITVLNSLQSKVIIRSIMKGFDSFYFSQIIDNINGLMEEINQESNSLTSASKKSSRSYRNVEINGIQLSEDQLNSLDKILHMPVHNGLYWYDNLSGAWGMQGSPVAGFTQPGLQLGGKLKSDASNGNTGVFINGRQLHALDVVGLQQITPVYPGKYWVDAMGNFGFEGGFMLGNLWALSQQTGSASSGSGGAWTAKSSSGTVGGDGQGFVYYDGKNGTSWSN